jgi:hypothetical protein
LTYSEQMSAKDTVVMELFWHRLSTFVYGQVT